MTGQSTDGTERSEGELLPPRDGEINTIPDVESGDKIRVQSVYNSDPNRNLTVSEVPREDTVILEGYGTEYVLSADDGINFRRVYLQWQSRPEGVPIANVEVRERGGRDV
jgi:hypothetical protein